MNRSTLEEWFPLALRYGGLFLLFFFVAFWAVTGRVEPILFAGAGTMAGLGEGAKAVRELSQARPPQQHQEDGETS